MISYANATSKNYPAVYLCTMSQKVMTDPVLGMCGHLFERSVIAKNPVCPVDHTYSHKTISCSELKSEIENAKMLNCSSTKPLSSTKATMLKLHTIDNAHADDIHGLLTLDSDTFVSGSKDTTLKIWNRKGEMVQELSPNSSKSYQNWITALSSLSDNQWASGTRNGIVSIWDNAGKCLQNIELTNEAQKNCKERNNSRVCGLSRSVNDSHFYIGTPGSVLQCDLKTRTITNEYFAHNNDWVYCIDPISAEKIMVVVGPVLELWDMTNNAPVKTHIIKEGKSPKRSFGFISSIAAVNSLYSQVAASFFDGSMRIYDTETSVLLNCYNEHVINKRVWNVIKLAENQFATSSDDGSIKLWDIRQKKSTLTVQRNFGRVSSLLKLGADLLLSGSCPDDLKKTNERARIDFWDFRCI